MFSRAVNLFLLKSLPHFQPHFQPVCAIIMPVFTNCEIIFVSFNFSDVEKFHVQTLALSGFKHIHACNLQKTFLFSDFSQRTNSKKHRRNNEVNPIP